ncbi:MAG: hypothetical protein F7B95_01030 [Desulfurococcales archaeon]|nr:hypothetical protein [Desulfurococcales archaeon]
MTGDKAECLSIKVIVKGLKRIHEDLVEALDRTPYTISSRPLIESSLKLLEAVINETSALARSIECGDIRE